MPGSDVRRLHNPNERAGSKNPARLHVEIFVQIFSHHGERCIFASAFKGKSELSH